MLDSYADKMSAKISELSAKLIDVNLHPNAKSCLIGKRASLAIELNRFHSFAEKIKKLAKYDGDDKNSLLKDVNEVNWKAIKKKKKNRLTPECSVV